MSRYIYLPFDEKVKRLLDALTSQNDLVRRENKVKNNYVFITRYGTKVTSNQSHSNIQKRLNKYSREYGLKNINPHSLRRGFARNLLDKNANIALYEYMIYAKKRYHSVL